jgi:hypothetical protein
MFPLDDGFPFSELPHSNTEVAMPSASVPNRITVGDIPELERKLSLICGHCERKGKYHVGRVLLDPARLRAFEAGEAQFEEAVSFSGIFFCKHCGAGGPWKIPFTTSLALLALLKFSSEPGEYGVQLGQLQLFDGTRLRTGAEAEAYLKQKLDEQPENAFIWGRLANLYDHSGLLDQAKSAFEKAIQLDPGEVESLYNLGSLLRDEGDWKRAAECFESAVRHAQTAPNTSPELLEKLVRTCLEELFELHCESDGEIPFPPKFPTPPIEADERPQSLGIVNLDLASEEGIQILTSIYLTGKLPEPVRERAATVRVATASQEGLPPSEFPRLESQGGTIRPEKRTGRNDPCPCGSGKKYKRCCLAR